MDGFSSHFGANTYMPRDFNSVCILEDLYIFLKTHSEARQ